MKRKPFNGHPIKRAKTNIKAPMPRAELKALDTATADYICDTTGSVTLLNGVTQGSDFTNRIGRRWTIKTVQVEGYFHGTGALSNAAGSHLRLMIIYDHQPNGALPAVTDVLTAATSHSFLNLNNRDRFRVIMDKQVTVDPMDNDATLTSLAGTTKKLVFYKRVNLPVVNDGTTNGIGDIQTGSLFLLSIGSSTEDYTFSGAVRIRFVDP